MNDAIEAYVLEGTTQHEKQKGSGTVSCCNPDMKQMQAVNMLDMQVTACVTGRVAWLL